jgi:hypothetical protein
MTPIAFNKSMGRRSKAMGPSAPRRLGCPGLDSSSRVFLVVMAIFVAVASFPMMQCAHVHVADATYQVGMFPLFDPWAVAKTLQHGAG